MMAPAARYTRFVVFGKHFLWVLAGLLVVMVVWVATYNSESGSRRIVFTNAGQMASELLNVMENPRYQGLDAHDQPYTILADHATQQDENHVTLDNVRAEITQHDGTWIALNAKGGALQIEEKKLQLTGGVEMFTDGGYQVQSDHAFVDIKEGSAYGDAHVEGQGPAGTLEAERFEIEDRGAVLRFKDKVKVRIYHD